MKLAPFTHADAIVACSLAVTFAGTPVAVLPSDTVTMHSALAAAIGVDERAARRNWGV